ncbi:polyhomeotic-like protein 2 isoform X2 [Hypomesus transpacificus]|uniref:polyhomeotic-like protein 2 isoform X2 n=1 Tax=Hypomesus transpacificus TaxID=137520 RepID=UPI001F071BDA|nr:polyhomeotic-like protein 2 isoform X2 [Hypomesus transpacificus]
MQNEQGPSASSEGITTPSITSVAASIVTTTSMGSPTVSQISVYGGIPDRQTVQVIQQALHRQPSTAAQYLQQMYAAQQQHLMLQTAAQQQHLMLQTAAQQQHLMLQTAAQQQHLMLQTAAQQQHLSSAQLQSLAAVQQASMMAGRQSSNENSNTTQQTGIAQTTINLATPTTSAQLINRAQCVSSAPTSIPRQAVLLGNACSQALTASQAQMYLRAQMLIFTPSAAVTAVQSEASAQFSNRPSACAQVQNLDIHSQQGTLSTCPSTLTSSSTSSSCAQLQGLCLKQTSTGSQLSLPAAHFRSPAQGPGQRASPQGVSSGGGQKAEGPLELTHLVSVSRSLTAVSSHPLISPAYTQIQTHQLLQQHKQQQFVIQQQQQSHPPQRSQAAVLHTTSLNTHTQGQTVQDLAIHLQGQTHSRQGPVPVLPKIPVPSQQTTIFHATVTPKVLAHNGSTQTQNGSSCTQNDSRPTPSQSQAGQPSAKPLQQAAVNLQIEPQYPIQDSANKVMSKLELAMDHSSTPFNQQLTMKSSQEGTTRELGPDTLSKPIIHPEDKGGVERLNAKPPGACSAPVMTSGNGNNAPTVTGSTPQNGESKPPQAIVKPQILTHVIEGFVIQEGAEPFPVERPSFLIENLKKQKLTHINTTDSEMEDLSQQDLKQQQQEEPMLTCELCGRVDFAYIFKRSKRFCSTVCAKRYNVGCTKRVGLFPNRNTTMEKLKKQRASNGNNQNTSLESKKQTTAAKQPAGGSLSSVHAGQGESGHFSDMSSYDGPPSPLSAASSGTLRVQTGRGPERLESCGRQLPLLSQHFLPSDPGKWNVEHVYEFICSLPGCLEIAEEFRSQEIDGQALLLLKEDHLMGTMNIKLGPALKIFAQISMLRDS